MPRFYRIYRLLVGKESGVEIIPPVRTTFDLRKDLEEQPNYHTARVWNLKPETTKAMQEPDTRCVLYAGYEDEGAKLIASGDLVYAYSYKRGPDVVTEINFLDGRVSVRDTVVTLGYGEGVKAKQIIADIAGQMGLPVVYGKGAPDRTWANGFSFYGAAHVALHKITRGTGLQWSIQDGQLNIITEGGTTPKQAFVLHSGSGLLGSPNKTRQGAQDKAVVQDEKTGLEETILQQRQQWDGWLVESLLLPTVVPGDLIKMESRAVQGWFKTKTVHHVGDS